jgi:hypothetical protein
MPDGNYRPREDENQSLNPSGRQVIGVIIGAIIVIIAALFLGLKDG